MEPIRRRIQWRGRLRATSALAVAIALALTLLLPGDPASAQGWWPWASDNRAPPPPRDRTPPAPAPGPPPAGAPLPYPGAPTAARPPTGQAPICFQLEQRLIAEGQRGKASTEVLPKIEAEMRQLERQAQTAAAALERSQCYEFWLFSKTLRRTPECVALFNQGEYAKRRMLELDAQRQQLLGSRDRSMQDELIRELARNNCGATYTAEAAKRGGTGPFAGWWQDEDAGPTGKGGNFGALPYATYRTLCVRLCDGYYFPVSFATLRNHFEKDQDICQSRCAAPVELYYYQNPGGSVEQMVSHRTQLPYNSLRSAFKYRKEVVAGCSCRKEEYVPSTADRGDRKPDTGAAPAPVPAKGVPR